MTLYKTLTLHNEQILDISDNSTHVLISFRKGKPLLSLGSNGVTVFADEADRRQLLSNLPAGVRREPLRIILACGWALVVEADDDNWQYTFSVSTVGLGGEHYRLRIASMRVSGTIVGPPYRRMGESLARHGG